MLAMNISDSTGESSTEQQENGDASGSDRPFKKARFAWQVKGKHHLKNETKDLTRPIAVPKNELDVAGSASDNIKNSNSFAGNAEQNLEILGDYLLKQDFNTLDSVITDTNKSLLTPNTSISTETVEYDNNKSSANSTEESYENENFSVPLSMVVSNSYCEDQCIARWQAKMMAKGFIDNTINRVLDTWSHHPPPTLGNPRIVALEVADFINNLPNAESVENEGILMAISAHGLHSNPCSGTCLTTLEYGQRVTLSSPDDSDNDLQIESSRKQNSDIIPSELSWTYADDNIIFPENTNSCQSFDTNDHIDNGIDYDADINSSGTQTDFMDTAISFAIQSKGLAAFGTDYG